MGSFDDFLRSLNPAEMAMDIGWSVFPENVEFDLQDPAAFAAFASHFNERMTESAWQFTVRLLRMYHEWLAQELQGNLQE